MNYRLCGGLLDDIKRKVPFYVSDFKDAAHVQCLASFVFLYFACLTPVITFGGLLNDATGGYMVRAPPILYNMSKYIHSVVYIYFL